MIELHDETPTARSIALRVPGWPGHIAGQHLDVRLTAADGYTAVRSYSIASSPSSEEPVQLTVEQTMDGEVSPYLAESVALGDSLELRGPIGGWFVWQPQQSEPIQLIAGGSGIVPLMSMIRSRAASGSRSLFRLLYSVRSPATMLYADELAKRAANDDGFSLTLVYTREAPPGQVEPPARVDARIVAANVWSAEAAPTCYVCGPTPFVENVSALLVAAGHEAARIRTERFGSASP